MVFFVFIHWDLNPGGLGAFRKCPKRTFLASSRSPVLKPAGFGGRRHFMQGFAAA
jgi:hypothetical protein